MTGMGYLLADDAVVCVKGRLDLRDDVPKLICSELKRPQLVLDGAEPLHVVLAPGALDDGRVARLRELLTEHPGPSPVYLHVCTWAPRWCAWPRSSMSTPAQGCWPSCVYCSDLPVCGTEAFGAANL
jgi:hypothetical protein